MNPIPFDAVLFDCDGVLVDSEPITNRVLAEMLGELGWALSTAESMRIFTGKAVKDEAALIEALREGRLAGAGLDVFDVEPLPPDHPFRKLPNTVITPHLGYVTEETYRGFFAGMVEAIEAWLAGKPINVLS